MKKVTIEITKDGYKATYNNGEKTYIEEWKRTLSGAKVVSERDFESLTENEASDEMYEALQSLDPYDIMRALENE